MLKRILFAALLSLTVAGTVCLGDMPIPPCPDPSCTPVALVK